MAAIVLALIGLIVYIMKDSNEVTTTQNPSGQLVNFQGADLTRGERWQISVGFIS